MSDLAKNLLTQYYGLNSESPSKRFLSIHKSIEDAKNEEEKQVTDQISLTTNEENVSENESQNDEDGRKLSVASESYRRSSRIFDDINDAYDSNENSDTIEIDLGQNILCDVCENEPSTIHEELSILTATEIKGNYLKDATRSDSSLTFVEDTFTENASEVSGLTLKKSQRSSRIGTPLPVSKKEPICNETFADFSNTEIKQFPNEILNRFSRLRMLYMADNNLTELPSEVFTSLRYLEWLDLRNNQLSSLPNSIESHQCIETLLLQGNKFEELPLELCTLAKLKTLQVARNPLVTPPKEIVALGCKEILEFLRTKWNDAHPERRVEFKESKIEPKLSTILCYQSPKRSRKRISSSKNTVRDRNASTRDKRKSYKPSNRCENKGANASAENRLLWYSKIRELFARQSSILQKVKDQNVMKEWRRDKRSFSTAMEKAMKRNGDDIPFGFDPEDYASIFKRRSKSENLRLGKRGKKKYDPPKNINKTIKDLSESLDRLEIKTMDEITPRTKQSLLENEIKKILQFQAEIENLRKYNDVATVPLEN
ncbi:uncharacterized protein LOC128879291 isoform X2 [Hylaeus volcanicus]|uniref:uncharacterized protein LOC128879291 isoform X2 n=1 Tax=Hylaeus volcanicus TaxID=313075 RepID=UPI0023B86DEC|nr:uncharacterized protein LOC128879291 isoform X2 [Hylaeus volcanicus]